MTVLEVSASTLPSSEHDCFQVMLDNRCVLLEYRSPLSFMKVISADTRSVLLKDAPPDAFVKVFGWL